MYHRRNSVHWWWQACQGTSVICKWCKLKSMTSLFMNCAWMDFFHFISHWIKNFISNNCISTNSVDSYWHKLCSFIADLFLYLLREGFSFHFLSYQNFTRIYLSLLFITTVYIWQDKSLVTLTRSLFGRRVSNELIPQEKLTLSIGLERLSMWLRDSQNWAVFAHRNDWGGVVLNRPSGAPLHTLSKLYDVPVGFVHPPPLFFEAVYCFICGRRRVAVARYRIICLILLACGASGPGFEPDSRHLIP